MSDRDQPRDPTADPLAHPDEPGAYLGNRPERQAETIPGGVRPGDERIAAHSTETGDVVPDDGPDRREAGQSR
jgi:hypothetical protein